MASVIRQEINILNSAYSGANLAITTNEHCWLEPTYYDGTVNCYLEVVGSATSGTTGSIRLREQGTTTDIVTMSTSGLGTSNSLLRSASFSLPGSGKEYFIRVDAGGTGKTVGLKAARVIIIQSGAWTKTATFIEVGNNESTTATLLAPLANPKYWKYDSTKFDGTVSFAAYATVKSFSTKVTGVVDFQQSDGTGDGFVGWADLSSSSQTFTNATPSIVFFATGMSPTSGRNVRIAIDTGNSKSACNIYNCSLVVIQTASPTKLEAQYLLANTILAPGTAFQTFLTTIDPTTAEWDAGAAGTLTFSAAADAANGSTSVVTIQKSDGSVTYATVSSPDNQGISTFSTTPGASVTADVKATTNNGDLYGVRILAEYAYAAAGSTVFPDMWLPQPNNPYPSRNEIVSY